MPKSVYGNRYDGMAGDLAVLIAVRHEHGINGPMPVQDIADAVGCSKSLISHIEQKALRKLRHPSRFNILKEAI